LQGGCANQQKYLREKPIQFLIADDHVFYREGVRAVLSHSPHSRIKPKEVMRDLDLVVSVVHAGEIDPESSTSSIESRSALYRETAALLNFGNIQLSEKHVIVDGKLSIYNLNLGSGVVHK